LDEEQVERLVAVAKRQKFNAGNIVILQGTIDGDGHDDESANLATNKVAPLQQVAPRLEALLEEQNEAPVVDANASARRATETSTHDSQNDQQGDDADAPAEADENYDAPLDEAEIAVPLDTVVENGVPPVANSNNNMNPTSIMSVPPPQSGKRRSMYIVRQGSADIWYQSELNPATLGPGTLFGSGGFLFGRQHSASVVAGNNEALECWVVDIHDFRQHVLPSENMTKLFSKYANKTDAESGTAYMTMEDFVEACEQETTDTLPTLQDPLVGLRIANTYNILKRGHNEEGDSPPRIYLADYCTFHLLMARPDPEVDIAFLLMDQRQTGQIDLDDLATFVEPFFPGLDLTSQFFQRYFGKEGTQSIRQLHFSQFLLDLQREMGEQAFMRALDENGAPGGYLAPVDFVRVLKTACGWRLPEGVAQRLESIYCQGPIEAGEAAAMMSLRSGLLRRATAKEVTRSTEASVIADMEQREKNLGDRYFAFGDFQAFQEILANLPGICNLIGKCQEIKKGPVSPDDFKVANRVMGLGGSMSRRQVDIIFQLFDLDRDGYVSHEDTVSVCGMDFAQRLVAVEGRGGKLTFAPPTEYRNEPDGNEMDKEEAARQLASYLRHTGLVAVASALGVVAMYPLDMVKTRLMNMRLSVDGKRMYSSAVDCLKQALRGEGVAGLYRGLLPQLLGVAPEKAIKLQVNDLLRRAFSSNDTDGGSSSKLHLSLEVLAGACAGACQLLVTNPMEIVKIRLQMEGETSHLFRAKGLTPPTAQTMMGVVRDLGFPGVYRGASACLLRDIPFSAIYFPAYTACKEFLVEQKGVTARATPADLLLAGTLAAVPAALLTTPADVIKTRLQVVNRPGETTYTGISDCFRKIYSSEGLAGLFRGSTVRVLRIAPQFGISLLAYEQLSQWTGLPANHPPTNAPVDPNDYHTAFPARAIQPKTKEIDGWLRNFGLHSGGQNPKS
jgi:solute carrier family 25 aspartate/glutamate transporter 12/13